MSAKVVIVDYGVGNIFSLQKSLAHLGASVVISKKTKDLLTADRLVLPGVGNFSKCIKNLSENGLDSALASCFNESKPILGICLGMQILFESSEEGQGPGLNLIAGQVIRFSENSKTVPLIGWNNVVRVNNKSSDCPLFDGLPDQVPMYFSHSFLVQPNDDAITLATSKYQSESFCSVVRKNSFFGCQLHPELSGPNVLRILQNFLRVGV
jgi:imidazole glycerol-phosphate synthase subunit HisH